MWIDFSSASFLLGSSKRGDSEQVFIFYLFFKDIVGNYRIIEII